MINCLCAPIIRNYIMKTAAMQTDTTDKRVDYIMKTAAMQTDTTDKRVAT